MLPPSRRKVFVAEVVKTFEGFAKVLESLDDFRYQIPIRVETLDEFRYRLPGPHSSHLKRNTKPKS